MGGCSSHNGPNPRGLDLSHFEEIRTVGKGGFGKVTAVMEIDPETRKTIGPTYAMKRQMKSQLIKSKSWLDMMWVEREIMAQAHSLFLTHLLAAFQSPTEVFFIMNLMEGGDLRYHLKQQAPFSQETSRFYAAQMLLGLECLHQLGILYRDLKPENCLLDAQGNLYLSDFGLSVILGRDGDGIAKKAHGKSGTKDYMAPEMLEGQHYGLEVDWWALGVTVHELLTRRFPKPTNGGYISFNIRLEPATKAFLRGLLNPDTNARLGCEVGVVAAIQAVKSHPFFNCIDWEAMQNRKLKPPITPDPTRVNFAPEVELTHQLVDPKPQSIPADKQFNFASFDLNTELTNGCMTTHHMSSPTFVQIDSSLHEDFENIDSRTSTGQEPSSPSKSRPHTPREVSTPRCFFPRSVIPLVMCDAGEEEIQPISPSKSRSPPGEPHFRFLKPMAEEREEDITS